MKKRILAAIGVLLMAALTLVGCVQKENFGNYSKGVDDTGYYENIDRHSFPKDLNVLKNNYTYDELLQWSADYARESGNETIETKEDYLTQYANEFLYYIGASEVEECRPGDVVEASLVFLIDGVEDENFTSTQEYTAPEEDDKDTDEIQQSFVGKKTGDKYEVNYVFPEGEDDEYSGKTAKVQVEIKSVKSKKGFEEGMVDSKLEQIQEYLPDAKDDETFLEALKKEMASSTLLLMVEQILYDIDIEVPQEYIDNEIYRFKARVNQLGYTYEEYLKAAGVDEAQVVEDCKTTARQNYVRLLAARMYDLRVTDEELMEYYGENYQTILELQGKPYMRMRILMEASIYKLSANISVTETPAEKTEYLI